MYDIEWILFRRWVPLKISYQFYMKVDIGTLSWEEARSVICTFSSLPNTVKKQILFFNSRSLLTFLLSMASWNHNGCLPSRKQRYDNGFSFLHAFFLRSHIPNYIFILTNGGFRLSVTKSNHHHPVYCKGLKLIDKWYKTFNKYSIVLLDSQLIMFLR